MRSSHALRRCLRLGQPPARRPLSASTLAARAALTLVLALGALGTIGVGEGHAAARDVQIVDIDFDTQVIELFNFGPITEDLTGWRFCSHNESFVRRYTSSSGLSGVSIPAGTSLFIHLLSDAGGQPGHIDRPAGNWADPLDPTAHGLQLYFAPVSFGNGATIADHLQWSIDGIDNATADERSDEAEVGGVWTDQSLWIATASDTESVMLLEASNGLILHGPSDYEAVPEPGFGAMVVLGSAWLALCAPARKGLGSRS